MTEEEKDSMKLLERISMFNDAVYAIVLTLLVLELKFPEHMKLDTPQEMMHGFSEIAPKLEAFLLSVLLVGGNWIGTVNIQRVVAKADLTMLVFTVIYLSLVSVIPFTCSLVGNYPGNPLSYIAFGVIMVLICVNGIFSTRYIHKKKFYHPKTDMKEFVKLEKFMLFSILLIAMVCVIAFFNTTIAMIIFIVGNTTPFFMTKSLRVIHD